MPGTQNFITHFLQHIDDKMATCAADFEEEESDDFDISLLRFLAAFVYVYLAFDLVAGVVQVSSGHLHEFFPGWMSVLMALLGILEVTAILTFLMELKRKVREQRGVLPNLYNLVNNG